MTIPKSNPRLDGFMRRYHERGVDDVSIKAATLDVTSSADRGEGYVVTATASTADVDLSDEIVVPEGARMVSTGQGQQPEYLSSYKSVYLNHDYECLPIGTHRHALLKDGKWRVQFVLHGKTVESRDCIALLKLGPDSPLRGVSIGFKRLEGSAKLTPEEVARYGPAAYITRRWLWLEYSLTPGPMNPGATVDQAVASIAARAGRGEISKSTLASIGQQPLPKTVIRVRETIDLRPR